MKRCSRCVLPETFPGITYDSDGICNFCRAFKGQQHLQKSMTRYRHRFEELLEEHKNSLGYDILVAYSGGKDSTYTLLVMKEHYGLSPLALTMDNGFISPAAFDNIHRVVEGLGIDHIIYKPRIDVLKKIFLKAMDSDMYSEKTLQRASTICTSCMGLVKFIILRMAIEQNIPFIGYGWSPGQAPIEASIFKNNPSMIKSMQNVFLEPMRDTAGPEIERYFLNDVHFSQEERFPYSVSPLAFLGYNEKKIIDAISSVGWKNPKDTDPNSTNCLLNSFANHIHKQKFHFNPYAFELAKLVREGYMNRPEAIKRLETEEDSNTIQQVLERLQESI